MSDIIERLHRAETDIGLLQMRVLTLEAELVLLRGSLVRLDPDEPAQITHNHPPDAPR
jgi:hypothetical protein